MPAPNFQGFAEKCLLSRNSLRHATFSAAKRLLQLHGIHNPHTDVRIAGEESPRASHHDAISQKWQLTVGIEIHAELNTSCKLFSPALTSLNAAPNTNTAEFDVALPGAQPQFQKEALLPAVRAALALGCKIQRRSTWDRKHYFWWDQPNGYQITQFYEPFAKDGEITLWQHDDIAQGDCPSVKVGIKQIQMEQDTAKTVLQPPSTHLLDFNRASHPLIEIISLPDIHSPKTAAAFVRKVQAVLQAVGANSTGMEMGGLRADVNVSVRRTEEARHDEQEEELLSLDIRLKRLGQRTEIKNLNSFKAVEDAIVAEQDRQIAILEQGGTVAGETRGWTLGSTDTKRLRGKEGEVDYRYMPDPDLGAIVIAKDTEQCLRETLPMLPDESLRVLTADPDYGLSMKDAKTLVGLDNGDRLEFYFDAVERCRMEFNPGSPEWKRAANMAANWVLHDIPTHLSATSSPFPYSPTDSLTRPRTNSTSSQSTATTPSTPAQPKAPPLTSATLAAILTHLLRSQITLPTARRLMALCHDTTLALSHAGQHWQVQTGRQEEEDEGSSLTNTRAIVSVAALIDALNLRLVSMTDAEYDDLARGVVAANADMAIKIGMELRRAAQSAEDTDYDQAVVEKGKGGKGGKGKEKSKGKLMWFVGQMVRKGEDGRVQPERAEAAVRRALGL